MRRVPVEGDGVRRYQRNSRRTGAQHLAMAVPVTLLADVPDPLAKPAVEEAANVVPACPEPASGGGCPGAAAAAGDHSERAFEFVTIAEDAVSAPSETSDPSEKEA